MATEKFIKRGSKWVIDKDPDAVLDYVVDFTEFLLPDTDSITSVAVVTTGGLVADSYSHDGQKVTVWLSGGDITVDGEYASATVRITTVNNPARIEDRTMYFNIIEK